MQTTKKIDRYPYVCKMTTDELMGRAINRLRFKSKIWDQSSNMGLQTIIKMVNDVRRMSGLEPYSVEMIEDGLQYRNIFAINYRDALAEFKHLCWGDW